MATPVTKRVHISAYKRNSIAKQVKPISESGYYVKNGQKYQYDATVIPGTKAAGANLLSYKDAWAQDLEGIKSKYKDYASYVADMESIKPGDKRDKKREAARKKSLEGTNTPGKYDIKDKPVMTKGKKGTQIDTSTAYGIRQISRGQKKAARDVRRAKIKLSKFAKQDAKGNWIPKKELNARQQAKFEERKAELKGMQNTQKRILDMASSGVDPRLTARYEYGRGMKEAQEGGISTDTKGLPTAEAVEKRIKSYSEGTSGNFGTVNSNLGKGTEVESVTENLTKDRQPKPKINKPLSTASASRADIGYSTMVAKKQGGMSMLKKGGMKMGGYGSKTYKK